MKVKFCYKSNFTLSQKMIVGEYQWRIKDILIKKRGDKYIGEKCNCQKKEEEFQSKSKRG